MTNLLIIEKHSFHSIGRLACKDYKHGWGCSISKGYTKRGMKKKKVESKKARERRCRPYDAAPRSGVLRYTKRKKRTRHKIHPPIHPCVHPSVHRFFQPFRRRERQSNASMPVMVEALNRIFSKHARTENIFFSAHAVAVGAF
jgi:hypothetical protein